MTGRSTLAFRYLLRQKGRTGFVVATYVMAVTVTLLLTSAVVGTEQTFVSEIGGLGVNWIYVTPNSPSVYPLTERDAGAIQRAVPDLTSVAPVLMAGLLVPEWGNSLQDVTGTNASLENIFDYGVLQGSFDMGWSGNLSQPVPMVAAYTVWQDHDLSVGQVFPASVVSLTGQSSSIQLVVTGLLSPRGSLYTTNLDNGVFVSVQALENLTATVGLTYIFVAASSSSQVGADSTAISHVVMELHGGYTDFSVASEQSWVSFVHEQIDQFTSIISLVEATLLVLSAMSVFVVMTMAVRDRRREIGVMRALGARRADVMGQFLLEAGIMSVTGMGIGILMGTLVATYLKSHATGFYSYLLTNPLSLGSYFAELLGVLWFVGFLFSMAPAYQASRLEAVEALRNL